MSQSDAKELNENTQKAVEKVLNDNENEYNKGEKAATLATVFGVSATVIASPQIISIAAPVLALSGIGLPLSIGMIGISLALQKKMEGDRIKRVLSETKNILDRCYQIHSVVVYGLTQFFDEKNYKYKADKESGGTYVDKQVTSETCEEIFKEFNKYRVGKNVIVRIIDKFVHINSLVDLLFPSEEKPKLGTFARVGRVFTNGQKALYRTFYAKWYTSQIVIAISLMNSYFIIYKNQYEMLKERYHYIIREKLIEHGLTNNQIGDVYLTIHSEIHKSIPFRSLIEKEVDINNAQDASNLENNLSKTKLLEDYNTMKELRIGTVQGEATNAQVSKGGYRKSKIKTRKQPKKRKQKGNVKNMKKSHKSKHKKGTKKCNR